jgi:hypothetical protein
MAENLLGGVNYFLWRGPGNRKRISYEILPTLTYKALAQGCELMNQVPSNPIELHSYPNAASSDSMHGETDIIFCCMKRRCCAGTSFLSPKFLPPRKAKVSVSLS